VLNFAVDQEWIDGNPAGKMAQPGGREVSRSRVLTADELRATWTYLHQLPADHADANVRRQWRLTRAALLLRLITAQRGREVLNIRWEDIEGDWWTIPGAIAKNGLLHRVPLTAPAIKALESLKADATTEAGLIFVGIRGTRQRAGALDGLGIADLRPHDFRRTAASMMTGAGVSRLVVSKVLNHAEKGITSVYDRHGYDAEKRVALDTWARVLTGTMEGKQAGAVLAFTKGA
jgi:integrase